MDDVAENRDNIAVNSGNIAENADNLQNYFEDIMNFDAITLIETADLVGLEGPIPPVEGALYVNINGNEGYTCDTDGTVDQHTADLLCQKVGAAGATNWFTRGERLKTNDMSLKIYKTATNVELELNFKHPLSLQMDH